VKFVGIVTVKL